MSNITYHCKNWKEYKKLVSGVKRADEIFDQDKMDIMQPTDESKFLLAHREAMALACFYWELEHHKIPDL